MRIETFIEYIYPGSFFSETSKEKVTSRTPPEDVPKRAFGYRFYDVKVIGYTREDGEKGEHREPAHNTSPWTYFGQSMTLMDVKLMAQADPQRWRILISNMENNNIPRVVRTEFGQMIPLEDNDVVKPCRA